jgi:hypothetical protein
MPLRALSASLALLLPLVAQEPRPFPRPKAPSRVLAGGETHAYTLPLQEGEYVKVAAEQQGVDLVLTVQDPRGQVLAEVDSPNGSLGPETFGFSAALAGDHRVSIKSLDPGARPGRYQLSMPIRLSAEAFRAHALVPPDPAELDALAGTYELAPGHLIQLSHNDYAGTGGHLALLDLRTRDLKALRPTGQGTYVAGPLPGVELPAVEVFRFQRDGEGRVLGLEHGGPGGPFHRARRLTPHTQETVTFHNGGVALQGKLLRPAGAGPFPAVVLAHGSGPATRHMGFYDAFFVHQGFAVLSFDKRGAGQSTGDWRSAALEDLAADVVAGAEHLRSRPDIASDRVGIHGGSQGGWVGALAAARDPRTAFLLVTCGSGVKVWENVAFEDEGRLRQAGFRGVELQEAMAFAREIGERATAGARWEELEGRFQVVKGKAWSEHVFPGGLPRTSPWWGWYRLNGAVDATLALGSVRCPVAWFLADRDWNVPPARSRDRLGRALKGRGTLRIFGPASHMMLSARTGHDDERASMHRFTPGYWEAMTRFLGPFR